MTLEYYRSSSRSMDTALLLKTPEHSFCQLQTSTDLHRPGARGWRAALPVSWVPGPCACQGGRACIAGGRQPSAPLGRPEESSETQLKHNQRYLKKTMLKISPKREAQQPITVLLLTQNEEWTFVLLHDAVKCSLTFTSSVHTTYSATRDSNCSAVLIEVWKVK